MRTFIVMPSCTGDPDTIWDSPLLKLIKGGGALSYLTRLLLNTPDRSLVPAPQQQIKGAVFVAPELFVSEWNSELISVSCRWPVICTLPKRTVFIVPLKGFSHCNWTNPAVIYKGHIFKFCGIYTISCWVFFFHHGLQWLNSFLLLPPLWGYLGIKNWLRNRRNCSRHRIKGNKIQLILDILFGYECIKLRICCFCVVTFLVRVCWLAPPSKSRRQAKLNRFGCKCVLARRRAN